MSGTLVLQLTMAPAARNRAPILCYNAGHPRPASTSAPMSILPPLAQALGRDERQAPARAPFEPPGTPFEDDRWELYHLDTDFAETRDLAQTEPERLKALVDLWWKEAERNQVLPLDDRFGPRFADNARRYHGPRTRFTFHRGMGHLPTDVAPDVRGRDYLIEAEVVVHDGAEGVLIAHGDATSGYSLYLQDGHLVHDLNVGGLHQLLRSDRPVPAGARRLGVQVEQGPLTTVQLPVGAPVQVPAWRRATLLIDGQPAGSAQHAHGFNSRGIGGFFIATAYKPRCGDRSGFRHADHLQNQNAV